MPRHINRVSNIKNLAAKFNLNSQILNEGDLIDNNKEILIINSFGVLHKYFNYCKNIFIGKSLIKKLEMSGGQNPIEAAKLGCNIFCGPYVYNFQEVYDFLQKNKISKIISNEYNLSKNIIDSFENSKNFNNENIKLLNDYGDKILKQTINELSKFIKIK